jgi:hypothetical protein
MFERNEECAMTSKILRTSFATIGLNVLKVRNMEARCGTVCVPETACLPKLSAGTKHGVECTEPRKFREEKPCWLEVLLADRRRFPYPCNNYITIQIAERRTFGIYYPVNLINGLH